MKTTLFLLLYTSCGSAFGQKGVVNFSTDFLYLDNGKTKQDLYYTLSSDVNVKIAVQTYFFKSETDSQLVYKIKSKQSILKSGKGKLSLDFSKDLEERNIMPSFLSAMKKTNKVPVGLFKSYLYVSSANDTVFKNYNLHYEDSLLSSGTALSATIHKIGKELPSLKKANEKISSAANTILKNRRKIEKELEQKGLTSIMISEGGKDYLHVFSEEWFMGSIPMSANYFSQAFDNAERRINDIATAQLEGAKSLNAKFREILQESKDNRELVGTISVSGNKSSGQETYSEQENEYYEINGRLEFPIAGIPISLSGFYTSQDKNRKAKASYFHFRYDAEKAKEQLIKLIGSYNKKYEQSLNQGFSYDMLYTQFLNGLEGEKTKLLNQIKQEAGVENFDPNMMSEAKFKETATAYLQKSEKKLTDTLMRSAMENKNIGAAAETIKKNKAKAEELYAKAMRYYAQVTELESKISYYRKMTEQYKTTLHYDSLLAYKNIKELKNLENMSYKDIAKKAKDILPEGKLKSAITGLTNLDAGIFQKYLSKYTLSGQMLKGVDVGYDIGFAEIGGSYGNTEFIDRTGAVESYKSYSLRIAPKPILNQRLQLVYYGYSPSRQLLSDTGFFKNINTSVPNFKNPVSIISAVYNGELAKNIAIEGEYAFSNQKGRAENISNKSTTVKNSSAYNIRIEGEVPKTNILLNGEYEYAGKDFQNSTLPLSLNGVEKVKVGAQGTFFQNFLMLGAEYNYLLQNNFKTTAKNSKFGFSVSTRSKRYPSISLSYKPFTTFRLIDDTMSIQQKPAYGSVWTGRATYQIKKKQYAIRFALLYSRNNSVVDTLQYNSSTMQLNTMFTTDRNMLSLSLGRSTMASSATFKYPMFNNSSFINLSGGTKIGKSVSINANVDMAINKTGLAKYGYGLNAYLTTKKLPFDLRANFRNGNYKLTEANAWESVYSGGLEIIWHIKTKF